MVPLNKVYKKGFSRFCELTVV